MKTKIFDDYYDFLKRTDKKTNGISEEFAKKHPNYEQDNKSNIKCWCCINCVECRSCVECVNCVNCVCCLDCTKCEDCGSCDDCSGCVNCDDCSGCVNKVIVEETK